MTKLIPHPESVMQIYREQLAADVALLRPYMRLVTHVREEVKRTAERKEKACKWVATRRLIELVK